MLGIRCVLLFCALGFSYGKVRNFKRPSSDKSDGKSSLVFVFDTTGSMHNDLKQLKEGAEMILNTALNESNIISDFVFVPFHDPSVGPATVTRNIHTFKTALNIARVHGGGDCPEKSLTAIQLALKISRQKSFIYVFTDATAGDHRLVGNVLDLVQRQQSQVVFVLTGHCNDLTAPSYMVYQQIAAASSGQVFNLQKSNVHKVLEFVRSSIKGRTVNLASASNPAGYNHTQEIPVDSSLGEVTVSVAGAKPSITVVSPAGERLAGPPKLITTLDLSEIMVVKVMQPEPGNWTITVGSEEDYSVKVVGLSNLTFNHGFSVQKPGAMAETSYRPLRGAYNYMMLALNQANVSARIEFATLLDLAGNTLFEVPLQELDAADRLYLASPFIPPDDFFYIAINGRDQYGQELRRIGATAIQPKLPDVPYITTPRKVEARPHSRVVLACAVESLVPVTAGWTRDSVHIQPQISSLQSTSVEYVIEDMREEDAGSYQCGARNVAGAAAARAQVTLLVDRPQVRITPHNKTIMDIGDNITISCVVSSEVLVLKSQLVFNGTGRHYAVDFNLEPNIEGLYKYNMTIQLKETDSGLYSCIAVNRAGKTNQSTHIIVEKDPTAQIIGPRTVSRLLHSGMQLQCAVQRAAALLWSGPGATAPLRQLDVQGAATDVFQVQNLTEDGEWTCTAIRGSRRGSDSVHVTVLVKPHVSIVGSKNLTVVNGTMHEAVCEVKGKPPPRVRWLRSPETERLLHNTVTEVTPNVYRSVLTLNSSAEDVAGTYSCIGENSEGVHQDNLTVLVRRRMTLLRGFTDQSVELYYQVELECQVDSHPPPRVLWYHNGTELATRENLDMNDDNTTVYLKRVNFDDLGLYECEADNGFESVKVNGTLSVHGLASPVLSKETMRVVALAGHSAIITCRVVQGNPAPLTSWQYRSPTSALFGPVPHGVVVDSAGQAVVVAAAAPEHVGLYRCVAHNALGRDQLDVQLLVHYPPQLSPTLMDTDKPQEVKMGDKVTFSCDVTGSPQPIVVWTKDMKPIVYSKNVFVSEASELVVSKVSEYDEGVYTCAATNALGAAHRNFTLIVYEPAWIAGEAGEAGAVGGAGQSREAVEGQLVRLPCAARGRPPPRRRWTRAGHTIQDSRKYDDEFGLSFVANLTDFGEYVCTAENAYGNTSVTYSLYVWVPPYIEPPLETAKDVLSGANVTWTCDVIGFPIPTFVWEFNDLLIEENTTDVSYHSNGEISIMNANSEHEGLYSCVAENVAGYAKKSTYLKVNEPPKILEDNYTGPYLASNMDSVLTVACRATGKPKPYIIWSKDEYYLDKDPRYAIDIDGTLTIKSPSEDMSGNYICIAKNEVGTVNKTVPVEIYSLPARVQSDESQTTVTLVEGARESVECPVPASHIDTVKWYKNAKLIATGLLQFPNVSRDNASLYSCVVSNAVGSAHARLLVRVQWGPRLPARGEGGAARGESGAGRGSDVYFDCEADANPRAQTKWFFNSKPMVFEDRSRLRLMNIQPRAAGTYKCVVSNAHGTVFREFILNVLVPPFISEFDMLDVLLKEGVNATLECNAKGTPAPTVTWTFNNTDWVQENSSLISRRISPSSQGVYRCSAASRAGAAHLVYRVGVVAAAAVSGLLLHAGGEPRALEGGAELVLGTAARIACAASGSPAPAVRWVRRGRVLAESMDDVYYADLSLPHVQATDAGFYTCVASNEGGSSERTIKIDVLEPPKIFQTLFQNANDSTQETRIEVISGQPFYLHCHPYGNPFPEVYWFKDGIPLKLFDDTMVSKDYGEVIVVKKAIEEQSGNYTCVARNKVGNTSAVYLVDVLVPPPTPKEKSKNVIAHYGGPVNLTCPVEGSPLPDVMWIQHPYTELNENKTRFIISEDGFTMMIKNTEVSDSGKYSCIMTNKVGTTEVVFDVDVHKPPSIAGNIGSSIVEGHVVPLRRSIVLKCEVDGHPVPRITWLKDAVPLSPSAANIQRMLGGSVLALWDARARHAGQYICVADSAAGSAHRRYNVAVQVPGKWSSWSQWTLCNVTCGPGYQQRARLCQYIDDNNNTIDNSTKSEKIILDESACKGPTVDKRKCHMPACDGGGVPRWSVWSRWSPCSGTCGAAVQARTRRCRGRAGAGAGAVAGAGAGAGAGTGAGAACRGDNVQIRKCPGLPRCEPLPPSSDNNVYDSKEDTTDINSYLPEVTFETQPEVINSHYSPDIEEFYSVSGSQPPTVYFHVNVTENLDHSYRGRCDPGYSYNTTLDTCDDIDECLIENNHCHSTQVCENTAGAYRCTCPPGYLALGAGQRCLDINECEQELDGCEYSCVNTAGGYVCACPRHLRLHMDRHHCVTPALYRRPYGEFESGEYLSTNVNLPTKYTKPIRNT